MLKLGKLLIIILLVLTNIVVLYSQGKTLDRNSDTLLFTPDFFDVSDALELTLTFDIKKYMKEKNKEEYLPTIMEYQVNDSITIEEKIRIKARGISRQRHCFMPPFWLNINKSNINNKFIEETKKVKVVTICRDNKEYERYLLKEYMLYKIFNIITDNSFKVRLLKITYKDTGRKNKTWVEWAFMIEPEELLASRIEALPIEVDNLNYRHADTTAADIMNFFQYMIGNTDFTVNGRHNIKLLKPKDYTKPLLIPIPYDFDFAGFVNTEYANPADILAIEDVTTRYYLGMCRSDSQYNLIMDLYKDKREQILSYISSFEYIDDRTKKETQEYIEEFYKEMESPKFIQKRLKSTCRK